VILRGTANMTNVMEDLEFVSRDEHELGINIHKGFDKALRDCMPQIQEWLGRSRPVWVTGHSLGGSMAALLLATLDHRGFEDADAGEKPGQSAIRRPQSVSLCYFVTFRRRNFRRAFPWGIAARITRVWPSSLRIVSVTAAGDHGSETPRSSLSSTV